MSSYVDRSYAGRMKYLAGGINAQFRANKPTAPQENTQPGAVSQSYRTGRIFGQIPVNVDGDISPACACLETTTNGGGGGGEIINFVTCDSAQTFTVTSSENPYTITNAGSSIIAIVDNADNLIATIQSVDPPVIIDTPGTYIVACLLTIGSNKPGTFPSILGNTQYILRNTSGGIRTYQENYSGSTPQTLGVAAIFVLTTNVATTSISYS